MGNQSTKDARLYSAVSTPPYPPSCYNHVANLVREGANPSGHVGRNGSTSLHVACVWGLDECLKLLLGASGVDVNVQDNQGQTCLGCASSNAHVECVRLLVALGDVDINIQDKYGQTALQRACFSGLFPCVTLLLTRPDIDVNIRDKEGQTALHNACVAGSDQCVKSLLDVCDVDVNIQDRYGKTALHYACARGHSSVVDLLLGMKTLNVCMKEKAGLSVLDVTPKHRRGIRTALSRAINRQRLLLLHVRQHFVTRALYGSDQRESVSIQFVVKSLDLCGFVSGYVDVDDDDIGILGMCDWNHTQQSLRLPSVVIDDSAYDDMSGISDGLRVNFPVHMCRFGCAVQRDLEFGCV